ncbi:16S rRNA (guanine(527)-N(7))-methyltransferase RsmG [Lutimaribacter marinistellae]|uniref:Ribosomal RNA small subunit methyltransferase G n=1 Tax=Lutimaribacter marinistellae TaxID=1820329 RepID=A0ABV7TF62_9RHOB
MSGLPNVSRETNDKLRTFVALVEKWNPRINLVSRISLEEIWSRHVADSAQLYELSEGTGHWVDIGSGGGFPGIVCAILAEQDDRFDRFTLVESDTRKSTFLRTAIRECGLKANVLNKRIESLPKLEANVLSARALADLDGLLKFSVLHLRPDGLALFPKGARWRKEVELARQSWNFDHEAVKSKTEAQAVILKLKGITRV